MRVDEQMPVAVLLADDADRLVQFGEVLADVAHEVRRLVRQDAASVLAQLERVEVEPAVEEELGDVGLEEVVDVTVDVEHGTTGRPGRWVADERRDHRALVVRAEVEGTAKVGAAEKIRLHDLDGT